MAKAKSQRAAEESGDRSQDSAEGGAAAGPNGAPPPSDYRRPALAPPADSAAAVGTLPAGGRLAVVQAPLLSLGHGYRARHVNLQLDLGQSETLAELVRGLDQSGSRLKGGRPVYTAADAVRWLLDQLAGEPATAAALGLRLR